jgi:hypothetical protein
VSAGGLQRWRLANSLRSAYADGLLTQDTFAHRIDHLYAGSLVHPELLVGDLTFRSQTERRTIRSRLAELRRRLQVRGGDDAMQRLPILPLDWSGSTTHVLVGRGSWCDLVIGGETVSRRHAQLFFREGSWVLVDLDSRNGTYLNGARVQRSRLRPGDKLAFGRELLLVD